MDRFVEEIVADIEWRISQMSSIKAIPVIYSFSANHKKQHFFISVPAVYALWEGFVKTSLTIYLSHLKKLRLKRDEIALNLLTHTIDEICKLNNPRQNFDTKKRIVEEIDAILTETIELSTNVPTGANVNFDVISSLLIRFCVEPLSGAYRAPLDKLLTFRNKIAHGENAIRVEEKDLHAFIDLVENLMLDVVINIEKSHGLASFRKPE